MHLACPHCQSPIEVVESPPPGEVVCPSCGSSFHLEGQSTVGASHRPGQRDLGRFQLLDIVGVGAFGTVYKARDPELDRTVAIKIPRAGNLGSSGDADRFLREARSVAQLRHPSIVPVYETGQSDGQPYLVSEFVEGVTLADFLTAHRPTFRESAQLIASLADALHYAHQQGVVHRDVKPSNVMLEKNFTTEDTKITEKKAKTLGPSSSVSSVFSVVKLMDFGLAKREAGEITMTMDGQVLGTPAYMSPEQAKGEGHKVDGRSDVYSLGVILYELLTGELPFRGNRRMLLLQVLQDEPRLPRHINDHIPRDLETICLKAMAKEPARRYATAADLSADLHRYLEGLPILARPVGQGERVWRWCGRNRVVAGLLGAVTASLLVGTVVASFFALKASSRAREAIGEKQRADQNALEADTKAADALREKRRADDMAMEAVKRLYISDMRLAQRAWEDNQIARVLELLEGQRPERTGGIDLRGFEWHYWWRQCHSDLLTLKGHDGGTTCVAYSPEGKRLVSGGNDKNLKIWNAETGQQLMTLNGHSGMVTTVAFSYDGQRIVSCSNVYEKDKPHPGEIKVWDVVTGQDILTINGHSDLISYASYSPDGKQIFSISADGILRIWDARTGSQLETRKGPASQYFGDTLSPDGNYVASGSRSGVKVWNAATGKEILSLNGYVAAFSPDGKGVASGHADGTIKFWEMTTGKETINIKGHNYAITCLSFSSDGSRILSGSLDSTIKIWDAKTGQQILTHRGHTRLPLRAVFSPDGRQITSCSEDNTIKVWDAVNGQRGLTLNAGTGRVTNLAFSPDGKRMITICSNRPDLMPNLRRRIAAAPTTPLVMPKEEIKVWDATKGREIGAFKGFPWPASSIAFAHDGQGIIIGTLANINFWSATTGKTMTLSGQLDGVARQNPGSKRIDTFRYESVTTRNGDSETTYFRGEGGFIGWEPETGKEERLSVSHAFKAKENSYQVNGIAKLSYYPMKIEAISPDGNRIVVSSGDWSDPKVYDVNGKKICTLTGSPGQITSANFSPDGKYLVMAAAMTALNELGALKTWRVETGEQSFSLKGHLNNVTSVTYSPDGRRIASGSEDSTVRVWDADTGQEILTLKAPGTVTRVAFSPDGRRITAGTLNGPVQFWDATPANDKGLLWVDAQERIKESTSAVASDPSLVIWPRVAEFDPGNADAWMVRAGLYAQDRQWAKATIDYSKAIELKPKDWQAWKQRGLAYAEQEQWANAAADLTKSDELGSPLSSSLLGWNSLALAGAGDTEGHRKACVVLLEKYGKTQNPDWANNVAWHCVRFPDAVADITQALQLAEKSVAMKPNQHPSLNTLGAALFRAKHYEESVKKFDEAIKAHDQGGTPGDWLFLAMAHHKLGHQDEAKKWLTKAQKWIDEQAQAKPKDGTAARGDTRTSAAGLANPLPWDQKLELKLIRAEAEGLVNNSKSKN